MVVKSINQRFHGKAKPSRTSDGTTANTGALRKIVRGYWRTFQHGFAARCAVAAMPHRTSLSFDLGLRPVVGRSPVMINGRAEGQSPSAHQTA
jgi:hypothetical protein